MLLLLAVQVQFGRFFTKGYYFSISDCHTVTYLAVNSFHLCLEIGKLSLTEKIIFLGHQLLLFESLHCLQLLGMPRMWYGSR